jgi:hypothetical protein
VVRSPNSGLGVADLAELATFASLSVKQPSGNDEFSFQNEEIFFYYQTLNVWNQRKRPPRTRQPTIQTWKRHSIFFSHARGTATSTGK